MATQLQFKPSFAATAIYMAHLAQSPTSPVWEGALADVHAAANALASEVRSVGLEPMLAWRHLLTLSTQWDSNRELATLFLRRAAGNLASRPEVVSRIAGAITAVESAVGLAMPDLEKELALRVGPLREQWEARGPGILYRLATTTDAEIAPESATVAIVAPVLGGGGMSLLASNAVIFEGVLVNGDPRLPEVLRLAWLIAQLQLDLAKFSESIGSARLLQLAPLALLPPVLEAGAFVDLFENTPDLLGHALERWIGLSGLPPDAAEILATWWEAQVDQQVPWRVALGGLERLLSDA